MPCMLISLPPFARFARKPRHPTRPVAPSITSTLIRDASIHWMLATTSTGRWSLLTYDSIDGSPSRLRCHLRVSQIRRTAIHRMPATTSTGRCLLLVQPFDAIFDSPLAHLFAATCVRQGKGCSSPSLTPVARSTPPLGCPNLRLNTRIFNNYTPCHDLQKTV